MIPPETPAYHGFDRGVAADKLEAQALKFELELFG